MFDLSSIIMQVLKKQAEQVEMLGMAAVRCGYNALEIEHAEGIPLAATPSKLKDGTGQELGRWWYDLEKGCCYVQGTQPDVKAMYESLRAAQG